MIINSLTHTAHAYFRAVHYQSKVCTPLLIASLHFYFFFFFFYYGVTSNINMFLYFKSFTVFLMMLGTLLFSKFEMKATCFI